jgi:uncharacterized membrane protein HdeD (DUF308 family)
MMPSLVGEELASASKHWGLLTGVGILLIVTGFVAIGTPFIASGAAIYLLGILLIIGGVAAVIGGIQTRAEGGMALYVLMGVLAVIAGIFTVKDPAGALLAVTLLIAIWLFISGVFRLVAGFTQKEGRGWLIFGGILAIILGILIWQGWPTTALWFLGLVVGIEMIFQGVAWLMVGIAAKNAKGGGTLAAA